MPRIYFDAYTADVKPGPPAPNGTPRILLVMQEEESPDVYAFVMGVEAIPMLDNMKQLLLGIEIAATPEEVADIAARRRSDPA